MGEGITVAELLLVLRERHVKLPSEIGAFVALSTCEALRERPCIASGLHVRITDDGEVSVLASASRASAQAAAASVHRLLRELMSIAGGNLPPMLRAMVEAAPPSGDAALARLHEELEASLIPLNRSASRRVLARLLREADRPDARRDEGRPDDVESASPEGGWASSSGFVPAVNAEHASSRAPSSPGTLRAPSSPGTVRAPSLGDEESGDTRAPRAISLDAPASKDRSVLLTGLAVLALVATLLGAFATLRPDLVSRYRAPAKPPAGSERANEPPAAVPSRGHLVVRVPTEGAQVLLFVGRGPAVASGLPIGIPHEFVVLAEGRAPVRSVVPADAAFLASNGRRVYELAIMATASAAAPHLDLGATELPPDGLGSTSGQAGDVRVITNPPGAKVYLTIGFAPEARVENLPLDAAHELLVFARDREVERIIVGPSDFRDGVDGRVAEIDVALRPRAR